MPSALVRLLRWSEKYTKTDMVYLASGGFWLTFEQILIGLAAFGVSIAFANFVSKDVYGTYRFLLSLFWTLAAFSLTGVATALLRAVARGEEGAYRRSLRLALLGALPISVIAGGLAYYYFLMGNEVLARGAFAIAFLAPFFQAAYLYGSFLEGRRDFRRTAIFGIFLNLVPAAALLVSMRFARDPSTFFIIYLAANVLTAATLSYLVFRIYKPNRVESSELSSLSLHLSGLGIIGTLANQLDQILVFHYLGATDLAIYSLATAFPDQLKSIITNLTNIAFPKFATRPLEEIQKTMWYRIGLLTVIIAVGIFIYILLAPWFFHIFFPMYSDAITYSRWYALTLIAAGSLVPAAVLQAQAVKRELYIYNIGSSLIQIVTLFVGVIWWGLLGVIIARGATRLLNLCLGALLLKSRR